MLELVRRPQFLLDLAEELDWLKQKAGPEVAERWYEAVCASINQLQKHPGLGRPRRDLNKALEYPCLKPTFQLRFLLSFIGFTSQILDFVPRTLHIWVLAPNAGTGLPRV